ncbi:uncharacterized protein PgNI_07583 [Pyricularia grisea]|uniref:Uncharacterized protein n=1 Tax=Pyricularia grisea TaxID=148305 RepID=A0A6P8B1D3_PYRGI|nr:uncharacterized protein PgNI_07583 [Pyricularia grisea]TLD08641.1 hypothetical protein PgNI_07583 [Pyricularia grisea]
MDEADGKIVGALGKEMEGSDWFVLGCRGLGSGDASPLDRHCNLAPGPRTSARKGILFFFFFFLGSQL